jgi:predicted phosphate transport protein (TIGR00153 family)
MSLQRMIDWLLPREDHFYDYLERQAVVAQRAIPVLYRFVEEGSDHEAIREEVTRIEKEGDRIVDEMLKALSSTFVTPIDREDLQRLSKKLDDVLDFVNLTARSIVIFAVERPSEPMVKLLEALKEGCDILVEILPLLRSKQYDQLIQGCQRIHKLEKQADRVFREELSRLFHDPSVEAKDILRAREILDHLETAVDSCDAVAETLTNVAVKHA